jgi:hypothetical protein
LKDVLIKINGETHTKQRQEALESRYDQLPVNQAMDQIEAELSTAAGSTSVKGDANGAPLISPRAPASLPFCIEYLSAVGEDILPKVRVSYETLPE